MVTKANAKWAERLKKSRTYKANLKKGKENAGVALPAGMYEGKVLSLSIGESQSKKVIATIKMSVVNHEEFENQKVTSFFQLEGEGLSFTASALYRMGYDFSDSMDEIIEILEEIGEEKPVLKLRVTEKDDSTFVNIVGISSDSSASSSDTTNNDDEEDDENEDEDNDDENDEEDEEDAEEGDDEDDDEEEDESVDDDDDEEETDDESELIEGDLVSWTSRGKTLEGEILEIDEEANTARVDTGSSIKTVKLDLLELLDDEDGDDVEDEEEEEEEEVKPVKKAPAKKTTSKKVPVKKTTAKPAAKKSTVKKRRK